MNIENVTAWVSIGISLVNAVGIVLIYVRYVQTARNLFCTMWATEDGEIKIDEPFNLR